MAEGYAQALTNNVNTIHLFVRSCARSTLNTYANVIVQAPKGQRGAKTEEGFEVRVSGLVLGWYVWGTSGLNCVTA